MRKKTLSTTRPSFDVDALMNTAGASSLLGIPAATLVKWRSTGECNLPYIRIGRQIRYRSFDLKKYIESNTIGEVL